MIIYLVDGIIQPSNNQGLGEDRVRVQILAQEHNAMALAWNRTRTAKSEDERTNHEATTAPYGWTKGQCITLFRLE